MYGGDEPTPTISTVNDQERKPGSMPTLEGKPLLLRRDASLDLFRERLSAVRIEKPGGDACYDRQCYLYNVSATITGTFLAASKGSKIGGYGHLGCCHLLVIQGVDEVEAERTAVPAGGRFQCMQESWNVDATVAPGLRRRRACKWRRDCEVAFAEQMNNVAAHWGDGIDPHKGTINDPLMENQTWTTNDLSRSYSLQLRFKDERHGTGAVVGAVAIRSTCRATSPPYPQDVNVSCRKLLADFSVTEADAYATKRAALSGQDEWRMNTPENASRRALEDAAQRLDVQLAPDMLFRECSRPYTLQGNQHTWCTWADPSSMQSLSVQLTRFGYLRSSRNWSTAPWILTSGNGTVCTPDSQ
jgi:hypothetical protein